MKPEEKLGYKPEKMNDEEFLINRKLLSRISNFSENKEKCNTRMERKNIIKRDIIY